LADAAIEAQAVIFGGPRLERQAELAAERLGPWLARAAADASPPPQTVLLDLAATPRHLFDRMGRWLFESDARRRHLALSAYLLRLLAPDEPLALTACSGSVASRPACARTGASSGCIPRLRRGSASRDCEASPSNGCRAPTTCTASGEGAGRCRRTSGCSCWPRCAVGPPTSRTMRPGTSPRSSGASTRRRARCARCAMRATHAGACTG